ncbi:MAG: hypothetical protein QX199_12355 [Methylococcaceae bacterium]
MPFQWPKVSHAYHQALITQSVAVGIKKPLLACLWFCYAVGAAAIAGEFIPAGNDSRLSTLPGLEANTVVNKHSIKVLRRIFIAQAPHPPAGIGRGVAL